MELLENLDPLTIALILLVLAGVWAIIELALFFRRTRKSVSELTNSLNETVQEFQPTVAKLDGIVDELGSSSKQIEPLLEKATTTVDLVNVNLVRTESVLADVNTATNTAANLSASVTGAASNAAKSVAGAVNKVAGKVSGKVASPSKLAAASDSEPARLTEAAEVPVVEQVSGDSGYFTYPTAGADVPEVSQVVQAAEEAGAAAEASAEAVAPAAEAVAEAAASAAEASAEASAPAEVAATEVPQSTADAITAAAIAAVRAANGESAE